MTTGARRPTMTTGGPAESLDAPRRPRCLTAVMEMVSTCSYLDPVTVPFSKAVPMSLQVSGALLERATAGPVDDAEFLDCIRGSLPYAWSVVSDVADRLHREGGAYADDNRKPAND